VSVQNWREWFIPPDEEDPAHQVEDDIRTASGSGHRADDKVLHLRKALPPRCASCKKFIGYDTGMHLMISSDWRVHIHCFAEVLERHYEQGEVIDLTTGQIRQLDKDDDT
jgi:hypothetical protein